MPVFSEENKDEVLGTLNLSTSQNDINNIIHRGLGDIAETADAYLIDENGVLRSSTYHGIYSDAVILEDKITHKAAAEFRNPILNENYNFQKIVEYVNQDGDEVLAHLEITKLGEKPLGLVVEVNKDEIFAGLQKFQSFVYILMLTAAALTALLALYNSDSITDPIEEVINWSKELIEGNYSHKNIESTYEEIDITMPGIDGYEVCRRLKNDKKTKDIPVIFISALDSTADKVKAFSVGAVDYVPKPFQEEEVQRRVETHLEIHWMRQKLENQNANLQQIVQKKVKEISDSQRATITALSRLTESRDYETGQHIERVQYFCKILAEKLAEGKYKEEIDAEFIDNIFYAAPLHDIGKIGIRDDILLKPGRLNDEEFEEMKNHTTIGADTLKKVHKKYEGNVFIEMGIEIARYHHEKWDGSGYNEGLEGEEIPLSARIMALSDVYDALRSERPYKKSFSHQKAVEIIKSDSGTHFDSAVVKAFLEMEAKFEKIYDNEVQNNMQGELS